MNESHTNEQPYSLSEIKRILHRAKKLKGNVGQKEATKARNRTNSKIARKSRRLNLRRGKVHGNQ